VPVRSPSDVSIRILFFPEVDGADLSPFPLVFGLPSDVVAATLGDFGIQEVVDIASGVSPTRAFLASPLYSILSYFSRSRTAWPSVLTGASRNATSRGAISP